MTLNIGRSSFTTRIALLLVAYLALGLLALGLFVHLSVQKQLQNQARSTAVSQLEVIQRRIGSGSEGDTGGQGESAYEHEDITDPDLLGDMPSDAAGVVFDTSGVILNRSPNGIQPDTALLRKTAEELTPGAMVFEWINWHNMPYLFAARPSTGGNFVGVFIPYASQEQFLELLAGRLFLGGLLVLFLVGAASYILSRRALHPVVRLTAAAEKLGSGDLKQRVPLEGPVDELHRLGEAFNRMAEQLDQAFARERQFVSDASHELRTPVAVIEGYARLLSRWGKDDPRILDEGLSAISESTAVLKRLVTQLLQLARDEVPEPLKLEPVSLRSLVQSGWRALKILARGRQLKLDAFPDDVEAWLDPASARECLLILLENAVKFTPDGGRITIRVVKQEGWCGIQVADTGPGIASEHLDKIFDRFYRVDPARSRQTGGGGLGLAIARQLMDAQEGRISVESELHEGSRFTLFWRAAHSQ